MAKRRIKRDEVLGHIDTKINPLIIKLEGERTRFIYNEIQPFVDDHFACTVLHTSKLNRLGGILDAELDRFGRTSYDDKQLIRKINAAVSSLREFAISEKVLIRNKFLEGVAYTGKVAGIQELYRALRVPIGEYTKKIEDLKILRTEAHVIASNSISGEQAVTNLEEMGFDMTEFKNALYNVPAVQKFSVDPSILSEPNMGEPKPTK